MTTSRSTWKARERQAAVLFGATRTPLSGGASGHTRSDTLHEHLFVECKLRAHHAVCTLFRETAKLAAAEGKVPVVVLAEKHHAGLLIVCRPEDIPALAKTLLPIGNNPGGYPCARCGKLQEGE